LKLLSFALLNGYLQFYIGGQLKCEIDGDHVVAEYICGEPVEFNVNDGARSDVLNLSRWYDMISAEQWRKELEEGLSDSQLGRLRLNTHTGRPLGSDSFLSKLESLLGRRVRPLPVGRPKKFKKSK
jgi:hypothetical protein